MKHAIGRWLECPVGTCQRAIHDLAGDITYLRNHYPHHKRLSDHEKSLSAQNWPCFLSGEANGDADGQGGDC